MALADNAKTSVDITEEATLIEWTSSEQQLIYIRVDLGTQKHNLSVGTVTIRTYINGVKINPDSILANNGTMLVAQGRGVLVNNGDIIEVTAQNGADSDTDSRVIIVEEQPVDSEAIISAITPEIVAAISNLEITVTQDRAILGPCSQPTTTEYATTQSQSVKDTPAVGSQSVKTGFLKAKPQEVVD